MWQTTGLWLHFELGSLARAQAKMRTKRGPSLRCARSPTWPGQAPRCSGPAGLAPSSGARLCVKGGWSEEGVLRWWGVRSRGGRRCTRPRPSFLQYDYIIKLTRCQIISSWYFDRARKCNGLGALSIYRRLHLGVPPLPVPKKGEEETSKRKGSELDPLPNKLEHILKCKTLRLCGCCCSLLQDR